MNPKILRYVAENYTPPSYIHKQVLPKVLPMREVAFDIKEFATKYIYDRYSEQDMRNRVREEMTIRFAFGSQVRAERREEPPQEVSKRSIEPYKVFGFGGYASVKDAIIGFLNSEGLESVLQYWGIVPTRVRLEMLVPTAIIHTHKTYVYNDTYVNVMPVPSQFNETQIRYYYHNLRGSDKRYRFQDAVDGFDELTWLSSIPPTREEVKKAVTLPYEDVNFAPLMQRWG